MAVSASEGSVSVVIATRNRCRRLLDTLDRLTALPERPRVVVVDNASVDGTVECANRYGPPVEVVALDENRGAAARTAGLEAATTPYVAFSDDDSWWAPGALSRASALLDGHDRLGAVAARVLVGVEERLDPVSAAMRHSPLPALSGFPGPAVLGFLACGAVMRRSAYLEVGGFHPRYGVGGEEELLCLDLAAAGWQIGYADTVVAHHYPAPPGDRQDRQWRQLRNVLWTTWLRWPAAMGAVRTARLVGTAHTGVTGRAIRSALAGLPWVSRERRVVPAEVREALGALTMAAGTA